VQLVQVRKIQVRLVVVKKEFMQKIYETALYKKEFVTKKKEDKETYLEENIDCYLEKNKYK
jgi:hypothetical protein